ncbi:amino acid adenylation domain-containing protein [Marinicrinis sediminis]|uniref:Amino acid adenylation domain-containing protein n=1 Tax=Marinicrinis sediminis TaxID=1652465 RepID=A0ABW5RAF5_9BACL
MSVQEIQNVYPLTPMQEGMLFHALLDTDSSAYVEQVSLRVEGNLQIHLLEKSLNLLIARYDVLRTAFVSKEVDQPLQVVFRERSTTISYTNLSHLHASEQIEWINQYKRDDQRHGFDLEEDRLLRMRVFKLTDEAYQIVWSFHHILMDGWCLSLLAKDLFAFYTSLEKMEPAKLGPVYPYSDYFTWLEEQDQEQALDYWKDYLDGVEESSVVPPQLLQKPETSYVYRRHGFAFDRETTEGLEKLAATHEVTLSTVMHALWGLLLRKYNGSNDIVFGSVVSGRPPELPGMETMVGLFINSVPLRIRMEPDVRLTELLGKIHHDMLEANHYSYVSIADIQSHTPLKNKLIQHVLVFENVPMDVQVVSEQGLAPSIRVTETHMDEHTNYDLDVTLFPQQELEVLLTYNGHVYDEDFMKRLEGHWRRLAAQLLAQPDRPLHELDLLTGEEKKELLHTFQPQPASYQLDKTAFQHFERHAREHPDRIAVKVEDVTYTYKEINEGANRIAHMLLRKGIRKGDLIGIHMDRSPVMIESILGVWKAGGAYIPLDVQHPIARKQAILRQANAACVLLYGDQGLQGWDERSSATLIRLDQLALELSEEKTCNPGLDIGLDDLCYCLFTSGSTGIPKGVMIEHLGMVNHILAEAELLDLDATLVFAQNAHHCFDISVWQMFGALTLGGTTVIYSEERVLQPGAFLQQLQADHVTLLEVVPSYLHVMLDEMHAQSVRLDQLTHLLITGETAPLPLVQRWFEWCPDIPMINAYGPAEASDDTCQYRMNKPPEGVKQVPIGKPLPNVRMYVVDADMKLCPIGIQGELCVAGIPVGRGYLHEEDRTRSVFLDDPFVSTSRDRMYRTGDLGKWLPDGNLQFLGRKDHQVKLRGFRIELGEIESQMVQHEEVKESVVVIQDDDRADKQLCAYYTSRHDLSPAQLKADIEGLLPSYMVPAHFIRMDELPLNTSGKIDRKRLPKPTSQQGEKLTPPRNAMDQALLHIWSEVLGTERLDIETHFFECGGHSLKATILVSKVYETCEIELSVRDIFKYPTIAALSDELRVRGKGSTSPIPVVEKRGSYEVSASQKRLFVLHELEESQSTAYNMPVAYYVQGNLDVPRFRAVIDALIERHEILRTSFHSNEGQIEQVIHTEMAWHLQYEQLEQASEAETDRIMRDFIQPFQLDQGPLFRMKLLQLAPKETILLLDMHHIISDGVSGKRMLMEVMALYEGKTLPALRIQYKDYAAWHNQRMEGEAFRELEQYWLEVFEGELPVLNLPLDRPRPVVQSFRGSTYRFRADEDLSAKIRSFCVKERTTPFAFLFAAYHILLMKYSGQHDIIVGTPVSGREHPDVQPLLGMLVQTLAIRTSPQPDLMAAQFVKQVAEQTWTAMAHQDYPFERLMDQLDMTRDVSRNPLFDTMFSFFEAEDQEFELHDMNITAYNMNHDVAKFDLMLDAFMDENAFYFDLQYGTDLFHAETVQAMADHYLQILSQLIADPQQLLGQIDMLTASEKNRILQDFNGKRADYAFDRTLCERFEMVAAKNPERLVLRCEQQTLTYGQLNRKVNQLARYLQRLGLRREDICAVMLERSPEFVTSVLAIWKAGGAYVPMDVQAGDQRKRTILEECQARFLLTSSTYADQLETEYEGGKVICLDRVQSELECEEITDLSDKPQPDHLAYVLFTSGSTGKPKGVMIEHKGMLNHLLAEVDELLLDESWVFAQNAHQCFDISVWQLFGPLAIGGMTVIYSSERVLDVARFTQSVIEDGVTLLEVVPTYLHVMMDEIEGKQLQASLSESLKALMITGEAVKPNLVRRWFELCPDIPMINAYGPAEASDDVTQYVMHRPPVSRLSIPIGKPLPNNQLYVVDQQMKLCPIGVVGELCVAGIGVGRGYIHDADRTAQSFMMDPFSAQRQRLYRTGDMARWLSDGTLEYIGRQDFQVKIRGFRIELEEIEVVLLQQPSILEAVVVAKDVKEGSPYLCAYVVSGKEMDEVQLKKQLADVLPAYMIPAYIVCLDHLPLLENGKVNRHALPEPARKLGLDHAQVEPRNELEALLVDIWQQVLGIEKIGISHHFFELGGDSIKAIQITSRLNQHGYQLKMRDLFQHPQIENLVPYIRSVRREIDQGIVSGNVPLTAIQHWFFDHSFVHSHHWNQAVMLHARERFDEEMLKTVFTRIMEHHDALRMVYHIEHDQWVQENRGMCDGLFELETLHIPHASHLETEAGIFTQQLQSSLNLQEGPLVKLGLIRAEPGDHLLIVVHHLVMDGISWRILFEDLATAYGQLQSGLSIQLPPKTDSYKSWAAACSDYATSPEMLREQAYWREVESMDMAPLPKDTYNGDIRVLNNQTAHFALPMADTSLLMGPVHHAYRTEINDVLLTAIGLAVKKWASRQQILVCLEGHGREEELTDLDTSRTIGWFTSTFPVILNMSHDESLSYQLKSVKESLRRVPKKGAGYGILKYLTPAAYKPDMTFQLQPEIKFNYLGQFDEDVQTDVFQLSPLSHGQTASPESRREVALDIGGIVENGVFTLSITYSQGEYTAGTIAHIGHLFIESLQQIIQHCMEKETTEMTPSDVGGEDVSIEELDAILSFYDS